MSRGLGALQRRIMDAMEARGPMPGGYVVAAELCETVMEQPMPFDRSTLVSFRRALHSLERRGLVHLGSYGLARYRAEVLIAMLPTWPGPKPFPGSPAYNPTRAIRHEAKQRRAKLCVASPEQLPGSNT